MNGLREQQWVNFEDRPNKIQGFWSEQKNIITIYREEEDSAWAKAGRGGTAGILGTGNTRRAGTQRACLGTRDDGAGEADSASSWRKENLMCHPKGSGWMYFLSDGSQRRNLDNEVTPSDLMFKNDDLGRTEQ